MNKRSIAVSPVFGLRKSSGTLKRRTLAVAVAAASLLLAACSGGGTFPPASNGPAPLNFAYPYNGQQDVPLGAQIVLDFPGDIQLGTAQSAITLSDASGNPVAMQVLAPGGGIVQLQPQSTLTPDTTYVIKTTQALNFNAADKFAAGTTMVSFTTRHKADAPAAGGLTVVSHSPGGSDGFDAIAFGSHVASSIPVPPTNHPDYPFTNTLHLRFSEPVDPATVQAGSSFMVVDPKQNEVPGRLYVQGRYLSFEPTQIMTPGVTYKVTLTSAVKSINGDALQSNAQSTFNLVPQDVGTTAREFLSLLPTATDPTTLPPSPLNNQPTNVIDINSALTGDNKSIASNDPSRGRVTAFLGQPGGIGADPAGPFYSVLPVTLPAGTQFAASGLSISLGGTVPANLNTGNLQITLIDAGNAYFMQNPQRNDGQPTAVLLVLDLALAGSNVTGNGVLNQTVMDVQAVGTATASNGQLYVNAVGAFPITLAKTGTAIANLTLRLVLPVNDATLPDTTAPTLTAQSPSACLYAFGAGLGTVANSSESSCGGAAAINSFPPNGSPALTFSEPLDPTTFVNAGGTHDADHLQLTAGLLGSPVPFTARVEGSSVVLHPDQPLQPNTQYTITAGTQLSDLGGNALGSAQTVTFTTAPYAASPVAAAFLTALQPGLPCALAGGSGDFATGGDTAGYCYGDSPANGTHQIFPVFSLPANRPVQAYFTKPVVTSTITAADGCLTAVAGGAPVASQGSFALETIAADGACTGVVPGGVVIPHTGAAQTRSFNFVPQRPLLNGQRYWLVICGDSGSSCPTTQRITDIDGAVLNTDPLVGSGSNTAVGTGAGGPDIIMPFDGAGQDANFSIVLQSQPATDTNGNGHVDAGEHPQTANDAVANILGLPFNGYLAGDRPLDLAPATSDCGAAPTSVIGTTPSTCVPIILYSGGMFDLTSIDVSLAGLIGNAAPTVLDQLLTSLGLPTSAGLTGIVNALGGSLSVLPSLASTGRIILRLQGGTDGQGNVTPVQLGYIVPACRGTLNGVSYDYEPCIAVTLNLTANAPDGSGVSLQQQDVSSTLVGPLAFQNNGRLSIDLQNATPLNLNATAVGLLPVTASVSPGGIHLQLMGYPAHGS